MNFVTTKVTGKLCFEALETKFVPQNYLSWLGLETPSEVRAFKKFKINCYE